MIYLSVLFLLGQFQRADCQSIPNFLYSYYEKLKYTMEKYEQRIVQYQTENLCPYHHLNHSESLGKYSSIKYIRACNMLLR